MIYIGTSGFSYPYWKNRFYPEKLPSSKWLEYYATQFNTLELNSSFYRFPKVAALKKAAACTPPKFLFTVKAHKIITHTRRMKDVQGKIAEFMEIVDAGLGSKLACVLYQLPPTYSFSEQRLEDIVLSLSGDPRNVVEFRHTSWWTEDVYHALDKNKIHFCSVSYPGLPDDNITTGKLFYKRMHGIPNLFASSYADAELKKLAKDVPPRGKAFIYFNNTMYEAGYSNARSLKKFLEKNVVKKIK